jgi:uncharacterized membrane protein
MADVRSFVKREAATIIVLALSAIVFVAALAIIHSEDFLHGAGAVVSVYDKNVEFETATVDEVRGQELKYDEVITDAPVGSQELSVTVTSGRYKGEQLIVNNYFGVFGGVPTKVGDSVTLTVKNFDDGTHSANVYDLNRTPVMISYLLLFSLVVIVVGSITGFKSLIGLIFTGVCLSTVLIPLIIKGAPAIGTTFVVCAYVSLVCFTILGGVHRKSMCAFLGTVAGTFIALVFGVVVQYLARIDGLQSGDVESLYQLGLYEGIIMDIRGLLVAGIIICSLGAVMDVAMSISSTIEEIHAANPALTQKELFESGMNVGRDAAGTMTNTLILALIGGDFSLMVYFYAGGFTARYLLSTSYFVIETISGLSSSLGLVLAIPLTALISSTFITRRP